MPAFSVEVKDQEVLATLRELVARIGKPQPVLQAIGEEIMERAKRRFDTGTGPDGVRWAPNARSTIEAYLESKSGVFSRYSKIASREEGWSRTRTKKGYFDKSGKVGSRGIQAVMGKRPLIAAGSLAKQFHVSVDGNSVTVGSSMRYAAMQQFGGTKAKFPHLWGDIPARPFLPVTLSGDLYPAEREAIVATLNRYLAGF